MAKCYHTLVRRINDELTEFSLLDIGQFIHINFAIIGTCLDALAAIYLTGSLD